MIAALLLQRMSTKRRISAEKRAASREKSDLNLSENACCRTCLSTENLVPIFCNSNEEKMSHNLKLVTGLEIDKNDGLSQHICNKCLGILNLTLQFRRKSKRAEKTLLSMLTVKPVKYSVEVEIKPNAKTKLERVEYDYEDIQYADDYQNEEFDCKEDVKPIYVKKEKTAAIKPNTRSKHSTKLPSGPPYKCNLCSKEFRMKATFTAHLRFHTNYCVCESCGKRCRNNNQLQEHKRARHGLGRIHKCAYCEYSSATKEALVIHERRHTGERPYICDHCGATFHRRANLVQHIAIHLPDKNFQCDMCPKKLKSRKFLQIHKHNAHTGKRYAYVCAVCARRFEKPNKCSFCPIREKSKKRLQIHISKTHRVRRYSHKCPRCLKLFQRKEHAHRHLTRVHRVPRAEHPPVERVLLDNPEKEGYRPAPCLYDGFTHTDNGAFYNAHVL